MMFRVVPESLRLYATALTNFSGVTEEARNYANRWGSFTSHETGILGEMSRRHANFMQDLNETLSKLTRVLDLSASNLSSFARTYEHTDAAAAAEIDSGYPLAQRPITSAGS